VVKLSHLRSLFIGILLLEGGVCWVSSFQVLPGYQIIPLKRGESAEIHLTVTNTEDKDLKIVPSSKDWFTHPQNQSIKTEDWLKAKEEPFILKPGENRVVTYQVQAPKKAVGELMGMATFLGDGGEGEDIHLRLSVAVYVPIKGTEKYEYIIRSISIDSSQDALIASVEVENKGNVHMRLTGYVEVLLEDKSRVASISLDRNKPVYPTRTEACFGRLEQFKLSPGTYYVSASLVDIDWEAKIETGQKKFTLGVDWKAVIE